jgi:hypothetical protein
MGSEACRAKPGDQMTEMDWFVFAGELLGGLVFLAAMTMIVVVIVNEWRWRRDGK